jgi:MFS transporter, MHS family, alpha-ketoglutarate permease
LVRPGLANLVVVFTVGLGLYTAMTSIVPALMSELFPTALRDLGIGAWYNLTVATFGGTAPLLISALSSAGMAVAFFWYVAAGAAIAFVVILTLPDTRGRPLLSRGSSRSPVSPGSSRTTGNESAGPVHRPGKVN